MHRGNSIGRAVYSLLAREIADAGPSGIVLADILTRARREGWTPSVARDAIERLEKEGGVEVRPAAAGVTVFSTEPLSDLIADYVGKRTLKRCDISKAFPNRSYSAVWKAIFNLTSTGRATERNTIDGFTLRMVNKEEA